jgi:hypothetical protein
MKRVCSFSLFFVLALSQIAQAIGTSSAPFQEEPKRVTLYALNKYPNDWSRSLYSFKTGTFVQDLELWDLNYGALYVNEEWDWFSVSLATNARTVARDLGELSWGDYFEVPAIEPFPKLKEGETRTFKVDVSGADGEDGAPGAPAINGDGTVGPKTPKVVASGPPKVRRTGVPVVDPVHVKAIVGHMYVVRVVDNDSDFYVLFRVESLVRGDNCTITWKRIVSPESISSR